MGRWAIWLEIVGLRPEHLEVKGFSVSRVLIWHKNYIKGKLRFGKQLLVVSWLFYHFAISGGVMAFLFSGTLLFKPCGRHNSGVTKWIPT